MSKPSSKRSSISTGSMSSSSQASVASSIPTHRSDYIESPVNGVRPSLKRTRYERQGKLHPGDDKGQASEKTVQRRIGPLAIPEAEHPHRRPAVPLIKKQHSHITAVAKKPAASYDNENIEPDRLEYFGYVKEIAKTDIIGRTAQIVTSTGKREQTTIKYYQDMTLPKVGMLVYKRAGQPWWGTLVAK